MHTMQFIYIGASEPSSVTGGFEGWKMSNNSHHDIRPTLSLCICFTFQGHRNKSLLNAMKLCASCSCRGEEAEGNQVFCLVLGSIYN
ncbi:unnamed protein product [Arctogadus glacialis]